MGLNVLSGLRLGEEMDRAKETDGERPVWMQVVASSVELGWGWSMLKGPFQGTHLWGTLRAEPCCW